MLTMHRREQCNYSTVIPTELIIFLFCAVGIAIALKVYYDAKEEQRQSRSESASTRRRRSTLSPRQNRRMSSDSPSPQRRGSTLAQDINFQQRDKNSFLNRARTKFKILASFYQIVSQFEHVLQVRFPEVFEVSGGGGKYRCCQFSRPFLTSNSLLLLALWALGELCCQP